MVLRKLICHRVCVTTTKTDKKRGINLLLKLPLPFGRTTVINKAWIHLLKLWKKRFQFADKSIVWKDAFPHCWEVPRLQALQAPQAPHGPHAAATFRRQRERSLRRRQKLGGRG
jgi:hypothetical protein